MSRITDFFNTPHNLDVESEKGPIRKKSSSLNPKMIKMSLKHQSKGKGIREVSSKGSRVQRVDFQNQDSISFKNSRKFNSLKNKKVNIQESKGKESLVSIEKVKQAEAERNDLLRELNDMKIKTNRDNEKIKSLYNQIKEIWSENDSYKKRSNSIISDLLLEVENLRRQSMIQEITSQKGRLGFFSFANSFGRNMDDWIEGTDIRKIKDKIVYLIRANWIIRRRNSKISGRSLNLEKKIMNLILLMVLLDKKLKCS